MSDNGSGRPDQAMDQLQAEVNDLRRQLAAYEHAEAMYRAFSLAAARSVISSPVSHSRLLEMIVRTAASVIGAGSSSLFLLDHATSELVFEIATGPAANAVIGFRLPVGQGIAGLVAATGQPMAVSNVQQDPRHASHISRDIGYTPRNILCVPLILHGEIIGVLELLDRDNDGTFSPGDIQVLSLFADQAAIAIGQADAFRGLVPLIGQLLDEMGLLPTDQQHGVREQAQQFAEAVEQTQEFQRTVKLADLVHDISMHGDAEYQAVVGILESFAKYLTTHRKWNDPFGPLS